MIVRSALMVAGDKPKHLDKIEVLKADIAIINLEDGVFDKALARQLVADKIQALQNKEFHSKTVVRINALDECGKEDIKVLNSAKPYAIRVPKIKSVDDVKLALELIDKDIKVHLSIETKEALYNLREFNIDDRVEVLYLGILDLLESFKMPQSLLDIDNPSIDYILSKFLIDTKSIELTPLFFTFQDFADTDGFKEWCKKAKAMGYNGTSCISPTQVDIANEIFKADEVAIKRAKYIKEIFEYNKNEKNITGFTDEIYGFIDEPIYKDALNILKYS